MSSREIAELVQSRHDDVKRSIDRLVVRGVIRVPPMADFGYINNLGLQCTGKEYLIEKRDSYVVVAQLSPEFTGKLVDRWQELEERNVAPILEQKTKTQLAVIDLAAHLQVAELLECPKHLAQIESVKAVNESHSVDFSRHLLSAPAQNNIADGDQWLEPTDLSKVLDIKGGRNMNLTLERLGLQISVGGCWVPTPKGEEICTKHAWKKGNKSGYNMKWNVKSIRSML